MNTSSCVISCNSKHEYYKRERGKEDNFWSLFRSLFWLSKLSSVDMTFTLAHLLTRYRVRLRGIGSLIYINRSFHECPSKVPEKQSIKISRSRTIVVCFRSSLWKCRAFVKTDCQLTPKRNWNIKINNVFPYIVIYYWQKINLLCKWSSVFVL